MSNDTLSGEEEAEDARERMDYARKKVEWTLAELNEFAPAKHRDAFVEVLDTFGLAATIFETKGIKPTGADMVAMTITLLERADRAEKKTAEE